MHMKLAGESGRESISGAGGDDGGEGGRTESRKPEGRSVRTRKMEREDGAGKRKSEDRKWNEETASLEGKINSGEPANPTRPILTLSRSLLLSPSRLLTRPLSFFRPSPLSAFLQPPPWHICVSLSGSN